MGIGLMILGAGIFVSSLFELAYSSLWWIPFTAGFFLGLIVIYKAQKKYNGSMMS